MHVDTQSLTAAQRPFIQALSTCCAKAAMAFGSSSTMNQISLLTIRLLDRAESLQHAVLSSSCGQHQTDLHALTASATPCEGRTCVVLGSSGQGKG